MVRPSYGRILTYNIKITNMAKEGSYPKLPISIVFKNSDRANAKYKIKTISNKTIDDLIDVNFIISGIPAKAVIKEVGIGKQFHNKYRKKYNIK